MLAVRVTPRSSRDEIAGVDDRGLLVRVTAAPADGDANKATCKIIAKWAGTAPSNVSVWRGGAAREKRVLVKGVGYDVIDRLIEDL